MADLPPLRDFSHSRAVVMGTWEYANLNSVTAIRHSYQRMVSLLTGPLCGWPRDRLLGLENVAGPGELPDQLIVEFEAVDDVALFYYVGHGQIDADGHLCLGLKHSRTEPNRRAVTSLPFHAVRKALLESPATTKIVILDCCYSGQASQPANTLAARELDTMAGAGAYIMAASEASNTAWYEADPSRAAPQTYFTKYLAELVEAGLPAHPPTLRLHEIFIELSRNLTRDKLPIPTARNVDEGSGFLFAHNAASPRYRVGSDRAFQRPNGDPADAGGGPGRRQPTWRRRISALFAGVRTPPDLAALSAIRPFLPGAVDEVAARREIEHLIRDMPPGHPGAPDGQSLDRLIDALADQWVADVRAQHAHYVAGVSPVLQAAEAHARRARAIAERDRSILPHKVMALESALFRIAGRDQRDRRGDHRDASRL